MKSLIDPVVAASVSVDDIEAGVVSWIAVFDDVFDEVVAPAFFRREPRLRARRFLLGLLSGLERKNGWTIAEFAGDAVPDGMQRLLNAARWDAELVRDRLRGYVVERLGDERAVLVVDLCRPRNYADIAIGGDGNGAGEVGFSPARFAERSA